ncbi:MAG: hypothetical protein U0166_13965 [Acidobacteriota bacterium]
MLGVLLQPVMSFRFDVEIRARYAWPFWSRLPVMGSWSPAAVPAVCVPCPSVPNPVLEWYPTSLRWVGPGVLSTGSRKKQWSRSISPSMWPTICPSP